MGPIGALFFSISLFISLANGETKTQTYIFRVRNNLKPSAFSDVEHWYSSTIKSLKSSSVTSKENSINTQFAKDRDFLHIYKTVFHGFSAVLTTRQAQELSRRPEVLGVFPDRVRQIQTTRSPHFLGLRSNNPTGLLTESDFGSNVIIGIMDTGIWPEHRSFHDNDIGPIPTHWKGECTEGEKFSSNLCNKKLIGARYFVDGYEASKRFGGNQSTDIKSARDTEGHGTHTASTAAGRLVGNASLLGFASGAAAGIAPKARVAVYKICWKLGCLESDILAAFDKAAEDGVDIISLSVGGSPMPYYMDPIAIGSFGATERGILISASAGNDGPEEGSVTNIAPWITSVGASTIDRKFQADLVLEDGRVITGASLYRGDSLPEKTFLPIVYFGNRSAVRRDKSMPYSFPGQGKTFMEGACMPNTLNPKLVHGKIVVCDRGGISRAGKGSVVKKLGAAGVIVANIFPTGEGIVADAHLLPGLSLTESAANTVKDYIRTSQNPRATMVFHETQIGVKPAPVIASFSSRGPNAVSPYIVKPDLVAPGVNILAAWPKELSPTELTEDLRRTEFNILSGTSMSCPHVSGLMALLKGVHPDWSPAMIRSSLMTTSYMQDQDGKPLLDEEAYSESTMWSMGAGHVDPERAVDPGLVYDLTVDDYVSFLCGSGYSSKKLMLITRKPVKCSEKTREQWNLNYPVLAFVFNVSGTSKLDAVVSRTVTHVGNGASSYTVSVSNPKHAILTVDPPRMDFKEKGEKQSYAVRIVAERVSVQKGNRVSEFGRLTWTDGKHRVTTPIGLIWENP